MDWILIKNTIDGNMLVNMSKVKIIHEGEEQGLFCIYLDREAFLFINKEQRDEELKKILRLIGNNMTF